MYERLTPSQKGAVDRAAVLDISVESENWRWVHKYPAMCLTDAIPACKAIKLAALRHFRDIERDDIYLSMDEIENVYDFKEHCVIPRGDLVGQPMQWKPPHIWLILSKLCWMWADDQFETIEGQTVQIRWRDKRRFREAFQQVARKFAKTSVLAAFPSSYIFYTSPPRSAVYSFANKLSQASIVWNDVAGMIDHSAFLGSIWTRNTDKKAPIIKDPEYNSEYLPLAAGSGSKDGLDPACCVFDEAHSCKDENEYGVMTSAMGMQKQPLLDIVTTSGTVLDGVCTKKRKEGLRVLDPDDTYDIDTIFYAIFEIDDPEDWSNEKEWLKANPGAIYGMPIISQLRQEHLKAQNSYEDKVNFLTKHCNLYVNPASKWLKADKITLAYEKGLNEEDYRGKYKCHMAIDRAVIGDITSIVRLYDTEDGGCVLFFDNYQTRATINNSQEYMKKIYLSAEAAGDLHVVEDCHTTTIEHCVQWLCKSWSKSEDCEFVTYDPARMSEVALKCEQKGVPMVSGSQKGFNLSEPASRFEEMINNGKAKFACSLMKFACECAVSSLSKANLLYITKESQHNEKIDPLMATITALSSATLVKAEKSTYDDNDVLFF